MNHGSAFSDALDAVAKLPLEEQDELMAILKRRLVDAERERLAADIQQSRQEFAAGKCASTSADELMREILK